MKAAAQFKADRKTAQMMAAMEGFQITDKERSHAAAKAADIIAEKARAYAPLGPTGRLRKNIYAMIIAYGTAMIGAKYGKGKAPHAHMVEYGTKERYPGVTSEKYRATLIYLRSRGLGGRDPDKRSHVARIARYGRTITVKRMGKMPASGFFKRAYAATRAIVDRYLLEDFEQQMNLARRSRAA
jgi:HK97 gp10 family phage protein